MSDNYTSEVPFIEQLRSIPKEYRVCRAIQWAQDGSETGHQFIPVGFMMHRAADEIERLSTIERDATRYRWLKNGTSRIKRKGENPYPDLEGCGPIFGHEHLADTLDAAIDSAMERK